MAEDFIEIVVQKCQHEFGYPSTGSQLVCFKCGAVKKKIDFNCDDST